MWWRSEGDGALGGTLVYVGIGSGLAVGVALLTVAILFLRTARRYVDLAEERLELLRESEALLLQVVRHQGQVSEERRRFPRTAGPLRGPGRGGPGAAARIGSASAAGRAATRSGLGGEPAARAR